ncbi:MAG: NADPH-dependent FMN reductase [Bacteroidia bacterium]
MITIISGTNRPKSNTYNVAKTYSAILTELGIENQILSLEELPRDFAFGDLYGQRSETFAAQLNQFITPVQKFVVIMPEYNGTFPGVLKLFFDGVPPDQVKNKKMALVGVAAGRAGNLRGIDQLSNALHYLRVVIYPNHLPISMIRSLMNEQGQLTDEATLNSLKTQAAGFAAF